MCKLHQNGKKKVGGGAKPLRHLEEQLQELETLLRTHGAAAAPAAPAEPAEELDASSSEDEPSDEETGQLDLCLGKGSQNVSLHLRAAVGGGTGARLWTGGMLLAEWLLQATKDGLRLKDKQVLELGAGAAALPSIVAARCGASVVATDGLEVKVGFSSKTKILPAGAKRAFGGVNVKEELEEPPRKTSNLGDTFTCSQGDLAEETESVLAAEVAHEEQQTLEEALEEQMDEMGDSMNIDPIFKVCIGRVMREF
eukprot:s613_g12.t1